MTELVRVTIVRDELEAELVRGLLADAGIDSAQRITNVGFGGGGELPASGLGAREIVVRDEDAARAREILR